MTQKRYSNARDGAARAREACPVTLPPQAWGPGHLEWTQDKAPVWVWVQWTGRVAERRRGFVKAHNDRVVNVVVEGPGGGWDTVVWRNAVSHRTR